MKEEIKELYDRLQDEEAEIQLLKEQAQEEKLEHESMMYMQSRVIAKGRTCLEIYANNPGSLSGNYTIDPEETGNETLALTVYCNMTTRTYKQ
jgi:signal transduction histidine kinase